MQPLIFDDLRKDGNSDLGRGNRTDGKADGGADPSQTLLVQPLLAQHIQKAAYPPPGADHAQVGGLSLPEQRPQAVGVKAVTAGDDHHKIVGSDPQLFNSVLEAIADDLLCQREAGFIGKLHAVVHHRHGKIALGGEFAQGLGNMPAAQYDQALPRGQ